MSEATVPKRLLKIREKIVVERKRYKFILHIDKTLRKQQKIFLKSEERIYYPVLPALSIPC